MVDLVKKTKLTSIFSFLYTFLAPYNNASLSDVNTPSTVCKRIHQYYY